MEHLHGMLRIPAYVDKCQSAVNTKYLYGIDYLYLMR